MASGPQSEQLARTPELRLPKGKEQNHLFKAPDREMRESQGERELHLGEKEEGQSRSIKRNESAPLCSKAGP